MTDELWRRARRVLLVHAHPDDETLATGPLLVDLRERGVTTGLLTATRGEQGEIVPSTLAELPPDADLSAVRERELALALDELAVGWQIYLGEPPARAKGREPRRYTDSGMRWVRPGLAGPSSQARADSLTAADADEVADDIAAAIEAFSPDVVITYDLAGGYGHPDHVRCHAATVAATRATGIPLLVITDAASGPIVIDQSANLESIKRALRRHRTQVTVDGDDVVHSGGQREPILTRNVLDHHDRVDRND